MRFLNAHQLRLEVRPRSDAAIVVEQLQRGLDFLAWFSDIAKGGVTTAGTGVLNWPDGTEKRLGMKLLLFRAIAKGDVDAAELQIILPAQPGTNINANSQAFVQQVFMPMARVFLRAEDRYKASATVPLPAADDCVRLDHNSQPYRELVEALGNLERVLTEANDYPDAEDKEQRIAEVSAARRLLASAKVRVAAVAGLLVYFTHDLVTTAVGRAAAVVLDKIVALWIDFLTVTRCAITLFCLERQL